jgi:hypothetical protein
MKQKGGGDKERTVSVYVVSYSAYAYESAIFCIIELILVLNTSVLLSSIPAARLELALPIHSLCCASRSAFLSSKKSYFEEELRPLLP